MSDGDEEVYGPALPPGFQKTSEHLTTNENCSASVKLVGPTLPATSSGAVGDLEMEDSNPSSSDSETEQGHSTVIGPAIPNDCQMTYDNQPEQAIGPVLPPGFVQQRDDDDGEGFGPMPPVLGQQHQEFSAVEEIEERARKMKYKLIHGVGESTKPVERESWMTELPSIGISKQMGLVARKLGDGCRVKDEDQSVWTDLPADRARKAKDYQDDNSRKRKNPELVLSSRDRQMAKQVQCYNKEKRAESLLKMHEKKLKKKSKEKKKRKSKEEKKEVKQRQPFDRESDLNVNRFDNAQRKLLIQRSQELNSRFGHGGQHFL